MTALHFFVYFFSILHTILWICMKILSNIFGKTGNGNVKNEDTKDEGLALLRRQPSIRDRKKVLNAFHTTYFDKKQFSIILRPKFIFEQCLYCIMCCKWQFFDPTCPFWGQCQICQPVRLAWLWSVGSRKNSFATHSTINQISIHKMLIIYVSDLKAYTKIILVMISSFTAAMMPIWITILNSLTIFVLFSYVLCFVYLFMF